MSGSGGAVAPLLLIGQVEADGYWLSEQWLQASALLPTLLQHWTPGSELYRSAAPAGWLLTWPQARQLDSLAVPGLLVQRTATGWSSCTRSVAGARLSLLWGDALLAVELQAEDPAQALDLGELQVWVQSPPRLPSIAPPAAPPGDVRSVLPGTPTASAALQQLLRTQVAQADAAAQRQRDGRPRVSLWQRLQVWFQGTLGEAAARDPSGRGGWGRGTALGSHGPARAGSGIMAGLLQRAAQLLGRSMGLLHLFRWQHAAYLRRLMRQFDQQDWDAALRHAIPLSGDASNPHDPASLLGMLRPRGDLGFRRTHASIDMHHADLEFMRQRYRQAFNALDAAAEVDKAAFVLAELLRETDEALRYLARHGRHRSAAELAELRQLPIARQIALWLKAGERDRAMRLTLLHQAFAVALLQLRDDPQLSAELRRTWAARLHASGQLQAAIRVLWPLQEDRSRALEWLRSARELGLELDAQLLAREAWLLPEHAESIAADLQVWLVHTDAISRERLRSFGQALCEAPDSTGKFKVTPQVQALAREVQRALWCMPAATGFDLQLLARLQRQAADPYFDADQPKLKHARAATAPASLPLKLAHQTRGSLPIVALRPLRDGHCLLALGESGCLLVDLQGRALRRFRPPVAQLVGTVDSHLQLGLMPRGDGWLEVSRLDLQRGSCKSWVELRLSAWSRNVVDGLWAVAQGARVQLLDISGAQPHAIWDSGELPATVHQLHWDANGLMLVIGGPDYPLELWTYRPGMSLSTRDTVATESPEAAERVCAALIESRPRGVLRLFAPPVSGEHWQLQRVLAERARQTVWSGPLWPQLVAAQLQQSSLGLVLLAQPEPESDSQAVTASASASVPASVPALLRAAGQVAGPRCYGLRLWSPSFAPLLELDIPKVTQVCVASDEQHLWVSADGAVLRVDPLHDEVRWIVP